jgi:hypothetical protein
MSAGQEAKMAGRKISVSLAPISKEIGKAKKKLKALRSRTSPAHKKEIDLRIRALNALDGQVRLTCKHMSITVPAS